VAGKVENLKRKAREIGRQWLAGQRKIRGVFSGIMGDKKVPKA
jgi:hypothetical protein